MVKKSSVKMGDILKEEHYNHHQGGTHPSQWAQL